MKEGRSIILILRSLGRLDLLESTEKKVFSIILNTKKTQGDEAAEEIATRLMELVDSCETEEELLEKLHFFQKER
jgi:hypothetical protein